MKTDICIVGAGPAGLMAAIFAAENGNPVVVIEANTSPCRKLLLTGGGRCNITHHCTAGQIVRAYSDKGRFLSYSLHKFSPQYVQDFFARLGLKTRSENDGCVFPVANRADDVKKVLVEKAKKMNARLLLDKRVVGIAQEKSTFIIHAGKQQVLAERLIIATGGLSYPQTGCTGDGYRFAGGFGHEIVRPRASLVPVVTKQGWPAMLAGTAVKNVTVSTRIGGKIIKTTGAIIFTEDGIGGPAMLDMSRLLTDYLPAADASVGVTLDLAGNLDKQQLETRIAGLISANPKKKIVNILAELIPRRLSAVICEQTGLDDELAAGQLNKNSRKKLVEIIKLMPVSILRTRPIVEATVTRGGISTEQIEPQTMESKICRGLFFAGEVIDVDGPCGGYNLQICWSTGALAGACAAGKKV
jgi:predicted Rossmann fold flavoprotein